MATTTTSTSLPSEGDALFTFRKAYQIQITSFKVGIPRLLSPALGSTSLAIKTVHFCSGGNIAHHVAVRAAEAEAETEPKIEFVLLCEAADVLMFLVLLWSGVGCCWVLCLSFVWAESGTNEDGSTWYRESGEDLGENGYRCRWTRMGGQSHDCSSEWKETWWEKSDWTVYKELVILLTFSYSVGVEKSGRNAEGDSWWETWQKVLHQDEWSNLARIERSAQKQAKSGTEYAGWYEKWWEKNDAKGWTEKRAHEYGRLNEQSWWEKWGEHYDGRGSVLKWLSAVLYIFFVNKEVQFDLGNSAFVVLFVYMVK
ncbi:hypothetical protein Patl1_33736 [Pistacia atlantica]|uniref:Uncharacterized protein n=1 Tax=Pistacia atlantica TaxID=434234 RepID=A0ACC0ZNY8_9ROSI|nr:hypothetical protein Patl1_33736 [Pistacia atlantica]